MAPLEISLLSVAAGSFLGFAGSALVMCLQFNQQRKAKEREQRKRVSNMLAGMTAELVAIEVRYNATAGAEIEKTKTDEAVKFYFPVTQDYFSVFHANAANLGELQDDDLRAEIILGYTKLKGFVDTFRMNNRFYEDYSKAAADHSQNTSHAELANKYKAAEQALCVYGNKIREAHKEFKTQLPRLIERVKTAKNQLCK